MTRAEHSDDAAGRERELLKVARSVYCSWTPGDPSLRQLASLAGVQYHFVWRRFIDQEQARRMTLEPWMRELGLQAPSAAVSGQTLHERVLVFTRELIKYLSCDDYRLMLFLVVRDNRRFPWLASAYRRHIIVPIRDALEELIRDYGHKLRRYTVLRKGASEAFIVSLETTFALCALRPKAAGTEMDIEEIAQRCAMDIVAAVDIMDLASAA